MAETLYPSTLGRGTEEELRGYEFYFDPYLNNAFFTDKPISPHLIQLIQMYDFKNNVGYPTKKHLEAIEEYGILPEHRRSYGPVKDYLEKNNMIDKI